MPHAMKHLFLLAVGIIVGCSAPDRPGGANPPVLPEEWEQPRTAIWMAESSGTDSVSAIVTAEPGIGSVVVEGVVPASCDTHRPLIQYSDVVTGRIVLDVGVYVPQHCFPVHEGAPLYRYRAVVDQLPTGRYPLEVRLRVTSANGQVPSQERVILRDTIVVSVSDVSR